MSLGVYDTYIYKGYEILRSWSDRIEKRRSKSMEDINCSPHTFVMTSNVDCFFERVGSVVFCLSSRTLSRHSFPCTNSFASFLFNSKALIEGVLGKFMEVLVSGNVGVFQQEIVTPYSRKSVAPIRLVSSFFAPPFPPSWLFFAVQLFSPPLCVSDGVVENMEYKGKFHNLLCLDVVPARCPISRSEQLQWN